MKAIVVGCDLSPQSDVALERAASLAQERGAELVIGHAHGDDAPLPGVDNAILEQLGEVSAASRSKTERELEARVAALKARGIAVAVEHRVGPPDEVLAAMAAERDAELVVIGTHGHTGIGRLLLGSVATTTIRHAPCDVLVCRGSGRGLFARPVVTTDFTPAGEAVLAHAARLAVPDAPIDVIHAWQLPPGSIGAHVLGETRFPWSEVRDAVVAGAQEHLDRTLAAHPELGARLRGHLVHGPAATAITHFAESHGSDLIAVGAHGKRGVRRWLLGSVAEATVRHAPCSVLVVQAKKS